MDYCKCHKPKPRIHYDDRGEKVIYCDGCWRVIENPKPTSTRGRYKAYTSKKLGG